MSLYHSGEGVWKVPKKCHGLFEWVSKLVNFILSFWNGPAHQLVVLIVRTSYQFFFLVNGLFINYFLLNLVTQFFHKLHTHTNLSSKLPRKLTEQFLIVWQFTVFFKFFNNKLFFGDISVTTRTDIAATCPTTTATTTPRRATIPSTNAPDSPQ